MNIPVKENTQKLMDRLNAVLPNYGFTDARGVNAYIAASILFKQAQNETISGSAVRRLGRYINDVAPGVCVLVFLCKDPKIIGGAMDQVMANIGNLSVSDFDYIQRDLWINEKRTLICDNRPVGINTKDWRCVTFGNAAARDMWIRAHLLIGYRMAA